ncbi:hypothetical protein V499_01747 [Pseudogymnoascus sp. VKM F-103]|nr:hypothetical protein V499_01747 [Pseudogymnoascus sp. VKM F-103]
MANDFGFIGIGAMGYGMAMNIRKEIPNSSTLFITDVFRPSCEKFKAEFSSHGPIKILDSAREVAERALTIISIVPSANNVRQVYLDNEHGIIAAKANPDRLMLECSTIDVETARDVGETLVKANAGLYIDTPVSGGVPGALAGTLSFLVGKAKTANNSSDLLSKRLITVISAMATPEKIFYCGGLGAGLAAKISNNYLCGTILLATAEAMNIGIRSGVDKHVLYEVIKNSTGQSFMCDHVNPVPGVVPHAPSSRDYQGGFKAQMMVKDMTLGVDAAKVTGVRSTLGPAALEVYKEAAMDPRCINRDVSVIYRFLDGPE